MACRIVEHEVIAEADYVRRSVLSG